MDWDTFFKDNAQSLFTLAGVFLGSLITFVISFLNNRFEAIERDKDREEKRQEAKIQAREKWIERDILKIMDSLEQIIRLLAEVKNNNFQFDLLRHGTASNLITAEEHIKELMIIYNKFPATVLESNKASDTIKRLVHSFKEPQIDSSYKDFNNAMEMFMGQESDHIDRKIEIVRGATTLQEIDLDDSWNELTESAGKFQQALRNKLISIRDI